MAHQKSTNVRTSLTRAAFATAERVAPSLGAVAAERLWFTLPATTPQTRRSRTALPAGTAFAVDVGGRVVRGTSWGAGPPVYLVHGWGGWGRQLEALVPPLVGRGLTVVAFDALSHGSSDPGRDGPHTTAVPEMVDSLRAVVRMHGPPHAVVAHSLGAMVTAVALRDGLRAHRAVFVAPAGSFGPTADHFAAMLGFGARVRTRLMARVDRRIRARYDQPLVRFEVTAIADILALQGRDPDLLVVHDTADPETPFASGKAVSDAWPRSRLVATSGLGHRRILRDPRVVAETTEFVAGGRERTPAADESTAITTGR